MVGGWCGRAWGGEYRTGRVAGLGPWAAGRPTGRWAYGTKGPSCILGRPSCILGRQIWNELRLKLAWEVVRQIGLCEQNALV
jgi:hypothetical protein